MQQHFNLVAGLIALAMIIVATLVLTMHGMKDETLLAILATGAVGIANTIAGVPKPNPNQPDPNSAKLSVSPVPDAPKP